VFSAVVGLLVLSLLKKIYLNLTLDYTDTLDLAVSGTRRPETIQ